MIKRLFDIVIAAVLGILCLPVALLIACAVWLESGSRIIYPSLRIGQFGNPFFYYRFRTKVNLSDPVWQTILSVRPGITGLGLLSYLEKFNETDVQARIQPDLFYALNHSFSLDIRLMWRTAYLWTKMGHLKGKMRSNEK
jgi:lipopolysaccharide/colanic/teichoic acid biosynthesis glycosyltransferase